MNEQQLAAARKHLCRADPVMARLVKNYQPYIQTARTARAPYFHHLIQSIINQQLSVKAGNTIVMRVRARQGGRYFNAEKLSCITETALRQCGVSTNKVRYIKILTKTVLHGELSFKHLARQDDDSVRQILTRYPGIGDWSADMFLLNAMHRHDVLPLGDLVLRKSMRLHYNLAEQSPADEYLRVAEAWRPYRSLASRYLWTASI